MANKEYTREEALELVNTNSEQFPAQFKVVCSRCGREVAVRKDVFVNRVEKVYAIGGNLKQLVEGYVCKKCQKKENINLIGGPALTKSGSVKVVSKLMDNGDEG